MRGDEVVAAVEAGAVGGAQVGDGVAVPDLGSTNGTSLNGSDDLIPPHTPIPLHPDDRIHVGGWTTITVTRGAPGDGSGTGAGRAESWPHTSQKRPSIGESHAGQRAEGAAASVTGPMAVPHTSQ
nr:FHA domain-containing protein [Nocardia terpenica]